MCKLTDIRHILFFDRMLDLSSFNSRHFIWVLSWLYLASFGIGSFHFHLLDIFISLWLLLHAGYLSVWYLIYKRWRHSHAQLCSRTHGETSLLPAYGLHRSSLPNSLTHSVLCHNFQQALPGNPKPSWPRKPVE